MKTKKNIEKAMSELDEILDMALAAQGIKFLGLSKNSILTMEVGEEEKRQAQEKLNLLLQGKDRNT